MHNRNYNIKFIECAAPTYGIGDDYNISTPESPGIYYAVPPNTDPLHLADLKKAIEYLLQTNCSSGTVPAGRGRGYLGTPGHLCFYTLEDVYWRYKAVLDRIYNASINPIRSLPDGGFVLWGQKIVTDIPHVNRINEANGMYHVIHTMYNDYLSDVYHQWSLEDRLKSLEIHGIIKHPQVHGPCLVMFQIPQSVTTFVINSHNIDFLYLKLKQALFELQT